MYKVLLGSCVILALCLANISAQCETATTLFVKDPSSCSGYFLCQNGEALKGSCPPSYYFNEKDQNCDFPENVICKPVAPTLSPTSTTSGMTTTSTTTLPTTTSNPITTTLPTVTTVAPSVCNGTHEYFVASKTSCNDYTLCLISGVGLPGKCPPDFQYFSEKNQYCSQNINECTYGVVTVVPPTVATATTLTSGVTTTTVGITTPITTPTTTVDTTLSTSPVQTTTAAPVGNNCSTYKDYFVASKTSCAEYFYCDALGIPSTVSKCPDGFYFIQLQQGCQYAELVPCNIS